ncbi:MAG: mannonate dehydratase [Candidatus Latescibacteria bacterium]|nr:mannonate dehydratase [Candidatus Latescibacterota bacterium]
MAIDEYDADNIKIAHQIRWDASDDDLLFYKQIGMRWVQMYWASDEPDVDEMRKLQERLLQYDIQIYSGRNRGYHSQKIQLGQDGRDEDIERYCLFIRTLGELGIPMSVYDFHPANTYTTHQVERRGYTARAFDLDTFRKEAEKDRFDRTYSVEDIWDNYTYFINKVLPVAEEANVTLALHPDDPPVKNMNGVGKLVTHYDGYHRAEEIADGSDHWGLLFCVGTWSEGGEQMGKNVFEMIEDFGGRGKIKMIHFRNVSAPMPYFEETFPDDGYMDMQKVMSALRKVGFSGPVIPDHIPRLVGDENSRSGLAYCISYMRAVLRQANKEVG